jgi:hypothetical protein
MEIKFLLIPKRLQKELVDHNILLKGLFIVFSLLKYTRKNKKAKTKIPLIMK